MRYGNAAHARCRAAQDRIRAKGFEVHGLDALVAGMATNDILMRVTVIDKLPEKAETNLRRPCSAGSNHPNNHKSGARPLSWKALTGPLAGKSDEQKRKWVIVKRRCVAFFIRLCHNLAMNSTDRTHARCYCDCWRQWILSRVGI